MLTLEQAIEHCHEKAKELSDKAYAEYGKTMTEEQAYECLECATEHEQLAEWLTELKERREADRWITIDTEKDLPKEDGFYLTTVEYEESISGKLKRNTAELYFSSVFKRWSECGEDEDSEDDVIAWRPMPKPYESEATNEPLQ